MKVAGVIAAMAICASASASPMSVENTSDGKLYIVGSRGFEIINVNGCEVWPPLWVDTSCSMTTPTAECRSPDLRNHLASGSTVLRSGEDTLSVGNDRTIVLKEGRIVHYPGGARELEVDYKLPILEQQLLGWTFRRGDGSYLTGGGLLAYQISRDTEATARIPIPAGMNGGGTVVFDATPVGWDEFPSCPAARDRVSLTVNVPPVAPPSTIQTRIDIFPDAPAGFTVSSAGSSPHARIALGTFFNVRLVRLQGANLPIVPVTSAYTLHSAVVLPGLPEKPGKILFASKSLLEFGSPVTSSRQFYAARMGTAKVLMLPLVSGAPAVEVTIEIVRPASLGTTDQDWDDLMVTMAHRRGIPPQLLKGQLIQESDGKSINRLNFRYEPCSADATYVSLGKRDLGKQPYSDFAFETARGGTLEDSTIAPRNTYYVFRPAGVRRKLATEDRGVTALEIWRANDALKPKMNWGVYTATWCGLLGAYLKANPGKSAQDWADENLDFVAQTATASSYGVKQVMYQTAIDEKWEVTDPENQEWRSRDPRYLFDTEENHQLTNGGSIVIGTHFLAKKFGSEAGALASYAALHARYVEMFQGYNPKKKGYSVGVDKHSQKFVPIQPAVIFQ